MLPNNERSPVQLVHLDKRVSDAEFIIWDVNPDNLKWIRLELRFDNRVIIVSNADYFHAMQEIRLQLEQEGIYLNCYGASKNVYPSPMSIDMGAGHKAYRHIIGERAYSLASIFASGDDVVLSTVAEQEQFYREWQENFPR